MLFDIVISANNKTKGDVRFIKCIFLIASCVVNFSLAGKRLHSRQRVDFFHVLVATKSYDARKAQSVAALMPVRGLHPIKSDFNDDRRLDNPNSAVREFLNCMCAEPPSH